MNEQITGHIQNKTTYGEIKPLSEEAKTVLKNYEKAISVPQMVDIGSATDLTPIYEGETPPFALRNYKIHYPPSLVEAYKIACNKYEDCFMDIVKEHKNWGSDYQCAPNTLAFQVDGPAYPDEFLNQAKYMNPEVLAEVINARVFEYENNLAMYGLNGRLWPDGTTNQTWHMALDKARSRTGRKIAVLAGTEKKLDEMLKSELGASRDNMPPEETIREITGFDSFMGPCDLIAHYQKYNGEDSEYVFFGRTSRPKTWLRDPTSQIDEGFLADPNFLKYVRAFALTHNFDNTVLLLNHPSIITDTKEAMLMTGAAYLVTQPNDIYSGEFQQYLSNNGIDINNISSGDLTPNQKKKLGDLFTSFPSQYLLSKQLTDHLKMRDIDPDSIASGSKKVRGKPLKLHYGCYAHITGRVNRASFLNELMGQVKIRGYYIIQPEFNNLHIIDSHNLSDSYIAIDRVFFVRGANGELEPMESCRSLMPVSAMDGKKNNVHEGANTKCARIIL